MARDNTHAEILMSGAFAAFTIDLLVYPLDTIKTRMQSRDYVRGARAAASPYALRGLYQGIGSVVLATLPASGVFFTTYESAKTVYGGALSAVGVTPPAAVINALSSATAELASCLVLTPAEVIKQNAQMLQDDGKKTRVSSSLRALRMLRAAEGGAARRLLSGYTALAARNLPFTALQFPMFEAMRARLRAHWDAECTRGQDLALTGAVNGLSAGTSGALAAVVTTPTDVVKTRMMLAAGEAERSSPAVPKPGDRNEPSTTKRRQRQGALHLARRIYREHGIRGLFRGGILRAGWTFVGSGLYLGTYETARLWLRTRDGD